jgi:hypothetical protein
MLMLGGMLWQEGGIISRRFDRRPLFQEQMMRKRRS